jgi:UDP-N-acetylglucosamine:LPS N-acetylglucosamine transferase
MGHAIPDMAIVEAAHGIEPHIHWQFISYGTGAATLSEFGHKVQDLELPDDNPFLETLIRACGVIRAFNPRVVVSHEEAAAILGAKILGIPSIFVTEFLLNANHLLMQALAYAEAVILLADPGWFDEPPYLKEKIRYVGSMVREFKYRGQDRERARQELGMDHDLTVVSVLPGGWATEQREPIADLLLPAFTRLDRAKKLLCWVAGNDFETLSTCAKRTADVLAVAKLWPIEQLMVASDLIITKANRITIMEASKLGIPTISLSHGFNRIDDIIVSHVTTNMPLRVKGITSEYLAKCMEVVLERSKGQDHMERRTTGPATVAEVLICEIRRVEQTGDVCSRSVPEGCFDHQVDDAGALNHEGDNEPFPSPSLGRATAKGSVGARHQTNTRPR